jgi:hypothetical protein
MRVAIALMLWLSSSPAFAEAGNTIRVSVKGLVCAVCAQPVHKLFAREAAVADLAISLQFHQVEITLKPGQSLADERIRELLKKAGLEASGIDRAPDREIPGNP